MVLFLSTDGAAARVDNGSDAGRGVGGEGSVEVGVMRFLEQGRISGAPNACSFPSLEELTEESNSEVSLPPLPRPPPPAHFQHRRSACPIPRLYNIWLQYKQPSGYTISDHLLIHDKPLGYTLTSHLLHHNHPPCYTITSHLATP